MNNIALLKKGKQTSEIRKFNSSKIALAASLGILITATFANSAQPQDSNAQQARRARIRELIRQRVQERMNIENADTSTRPSTQSAPSKQSASRQQNFLKSYDSSIYSSSRQKRIPFRLTTPLQPGSYPVIILSHGAGGSSDSNGNLIRRWVSDGFVCIRPVHADSVKLMRASGAREASIMDSLDALNDPANWINRVQDIKDILDSLDEINKLSPSVTFEKNSIGMSGHSFGAFTSELISGATPPRRAGATSCADQRIKAAIFLSPQGIKRQGPLGFDDKSAWQKVNLPFLLMTGGRDTGRGGEDAAWRLEPYEFAPPGNKFAFFLNQASHMTFGGETDGPSPGRDARAARYRKGANDADLYPFIEETSSLFWRAFLKGDTAALKELKSEKLPVDIGYIRCK